MKRRASRVLTRSLMAFSNYSPEEYITLRSWTSDNIPGNNDIDRGYFQRRLDFDPCSP
jgi:hypothetical protein